MNGGYHTMGSADYNKIAAAKMHLNIITEDQLKRVGWVKAWRKKNNLTYWVKSFPEGRVTALTMEDALMWEYEL